MSSQPKSTDGSGTRVPVETIPITEMANELTRDLDIAEPREMARLFRQSDAQMFFGYGGWPALTDEETVETCAKLAVAAAETMRAGERGVIFLSGAGTSGRFSQMISRQFNRLLKAARLEPVFKPLIAGGNLALVKAQEGAEDDPRKAVEDMDLRTPHGAERIFYVGITCGLAAPYTAGQLHALEKSESAVRVLLGFNPVDRARNVKIEGWHKTFAEVVRQQVEAGRLVVLNPIYGPESLMGSTRMKGGSATKILLETIFYAALELVGAAEPEKGQKRIEASDPKGVERRVLELLRRYRATIAATYEHIGILEHLIREGGSSLRRGGKITYLGRETAGIVGLIDASECVPTFGATHEDVRGYLRNGWRELLDEDADYSDSGPEFDIGFDSFEREKLPDLSKGDLVLGIAIGEVGPNTRLLLEHASRTKATTGVVLVAAVPPARTDLVEGVDFTHVVIVPSLGFAPGMHNLAEIALKLCLNALSTGAHVQIGKVYENRMIDLRISNNKLYYRAIRTICLLTGASEQTARLSLHRAAFKKDTLGPREVEAPPSAIIQAGTNAPRVVPIALLLALGAPSYEHAADELARDPVPRRVIKGMLDAEKTAVDE